MDNRFEVTVGAGTMMPGSDVAVGCVLIGAAQLSFVPVAGA